MYGYRIFVNSVPVADSRAEYRTPGTATHPAAPRRVVAHRCVGAERKGGRSPLAKPLRAAASAHLCRCAGGR
jgi:hypothetical protein